MNEQQNVLKTEKEKIIENCLEDEIPHCTAICPFRLDVRRFIEKICLGNFEAAFRLYRDATGFPMIAASLCKEPCKGVCIREKTDEAVNMLLLEKTSISYASGMLPRNYNIPQKKESAAIIGAGISGLACALKLAQKKYKVTLFEKNDKIGGELWGLLPPELFLQDIETQFMHENWEVNLNREIKDLNELKEYDAVYIATGKNSTLLGLSMEGITKTFCTEKDGVFIGGSVLGVSPAEALAHGLRAANYMESYMKTRNTIYSDEKSGTKIPDESIQLIGMEAIKAENGELFTKEEAVAEASRCMRCKCSNCMRSCELMQYYKKMPVKISGDVRATAGADGLRGEIKVATKLIASCNQCGLCGEKCPQRIDIGKFLLNARIALHHKNSLPWAYHDFFLRDMADANGPDACVQLSPEGGTKVSDIFFSGCQLGASDPDYVLKTYAYLSERIPGTALMTNCCGAPAIWSGDIALYQSTLNEIKNRWEGWGKPRMIFACPTCKKMLQEYISEMQSISLYELLIDLGIKAKMKFDEETLCVFDPCSARHEYELQEAVRELSGQAGHLMSLPFEKEDAHCCGWGGHTLVANPDYTKGIVQKQIALLENTYITYCTNCRDIFASEGKKVIHILDILFHINGPSRRPPTISERRRNRAKLKKSLLKEFHPEKKQNLLIINEALKEKLSRELILEDCAMEVIKHCEGTGAKMLDPKCGHFFGSLQIGYVTYWVEYEIKIKGIELINAYCHRMKIETGAV